MKIGKSLLSRFVFALGLICLSGLAHQAGVASAESKDSSAAVNSKAARLTITNIALDKKIYRPETDAPATIRYKLSQAATITLKIRRALSRLGFPNR